MEACVKGQLWLERVLEGRTREFVKMLNTPPESSNSRSPREERARGSFSVPVANTLVLRDALRWSMSISFATVGACGHP